MLLSCLRVFRYEMFSGYISKYVSWNLWVSKYAKGVVCFSVGLAPEHHLFSTPRVTILLYKICFLIPFCPHSGSAIISLLPFLSPNINSNYRRLLATIKPFGEEAAHVWPSNSSSTSTTYVLSIQFILTILGRQSSTSTAHMSYSSNSSSPWRTG